MKAAVIILLVIGCGGPLARGGTTGGLFDTKAAKYCREDAQQSQGRCLQDGTDKDVVRRCEALGEVEYNECMYEDTKEHPHGYKVTPMDECGSSSRRTHIACLEKARDDDATDRCAALAESDYNFCIDRVNQIY